jgi:hypothetical protein
MALVYHGNNPQTTLASGIGSGDTTLTVASATNFPTSPNFPIIVDTELMMVIGVSGTTFTVTRGIEGTTAASHVTGAALGQVITAGSLLPLAGLISGVTFANLPAASSALIGVPVRVTDIGAGGTIFVTNGTIWRPLNGIAVLDHSAVASSHTGDTTETTLASVSIPANLMGPNGELRISHLWSITSSAGTKTMKVKMGGSNFMLVQLTTNSSFQTITTISNRNAANSQVGFPSTISAVFAASTTAPSTFAIDTSSAQTLSFTGQLTSGADTVTLERRTVELIVP